MHRLGSPQGRLIGIARDKYHRHIHLFLKPLDDFDAVHLALEADVHEHQIGREIFHHRLRRVAIAGNPDHAIPEALDPPFYVECDKLFVFDDQDTRRTGKRHLSRNRRIDCRRKRTGGGKSINHASIFPQTGQGKCHRFVKSPADQSEQSDRTPALHFPHERVDEELTLNAHARILVTEDDPRIRAGIRLSLESAGYRVLEASDGAQGLKLVHEEKPSLVILDVMMPELDGISTVAEIRRLGIGTPILMLTTQMEVNDRVRGLDAGADDYLGKPFDKRELLARVHALLRREQREKNSRVVLRFDDVEVNLESKTAARASAPLSLTRTEFALLELLAKHLGSPVSRDLMLDSVWGYTYFPSTRTVDTHIWRLRKKIGDSGETPRWIKKVHGEGYVLTCSDT